MIFLAASALFVTGLAAWAWWWLKRFDRTLAEACHLVNMEVPDGNP